MKIKIHGGTPQHDGESLCVTCRSATIIQGPGLRDRIVRCAELYGTGALIRFPVVACNDYSDRRQPSLHEMRQMAWVLRTDSKHHAIGFVRAADLKPRERGRYWEDE